MARNRMVTGNDKTKQSKREIQEGMSFTAKLDPNVTYGPDMAAQLRKLGVTLEATSKKQNKKLISIRVDQDVLDALKALGSGDDHKGWQPKTNLMLRKWLEL